MRAAPRLALIAIVAAACGARPASRLPGGAAPVFRGHRDVRVGPAGVLPWVVGRSAPVGFCLDVPPERDTSQWTARLFDDGSIAPSVRLGSTLCFEAKLPSAWTDGDRELCAEVRDGFDGSTLRLPCLPFRFDADDAALRTLESRLATAMREPIASLDALSRDAEVQGFPGLALRTRLVGAYVLRRTGIAEARANVARRISQAPAWVDDPAGARWAATLAYERSMLALDADADLATCWHLLRTAERSFRRCGDRKWIAVAGKQAEVLFRAGALAEGKERLRRALGACGAAPCDPALARAAENTLAWLVAADPDAGEDELAEARRALEALQTGDAAPADPFERANLLLNRAFVDVRLGRPPDPALVPARQLIGPGPALRARELSGWADLVEAHRALSLGRAKEASAIGERLDQPGRSDRLRAFGLGCAGAAERRLGHLERASDLFGRALDLHGRGSARRLGQDVPLGPGQRAEDAYAAARVAIERGRDADAWGILRALDEAAASPGGSSPAWLAELDALDGPASGTRREQRQAIRWGELDVLQEFLRTRASTAPPAPLDDAGVDYRAFPLDDEIVVLKRTPSGSARVYRRTPMRRAALGALIRGAREAMDRGESDDARWRALVAPLAAALAPDPSDVGPVTTYAVHGILQEVPLAALPVRGRWLGEITTIVSHPAVGVSPAPRRTATRGAVLVSDPRGDLGLPPPVAEARVLLRGEATRDALRHALEGARRLHIDAHARYEPAFPELSTILLADGPITGNELAAWGAALEMANLSGCQTGRSPVSADSGRYGIAGLLARSGVRWVIGTRAPLANDVALAFNRAFCADLDAGQDVPVAYRHALDRVRSGHPASRWAVLLLLGGQSPSP
ncbi:MAG TPA: CHAT domain-containing protein, partial [Candidatus Bathyarchaeia archaeon]|nr:CHAT domain-containing protein [Candidatus Bathyarchaeia archaeon]